LDQCNDFLEIKEQMLEINFTPFPILTTDRLVLRQLEPSDDLDIYSHRSDEGVIDTLMALSILLWKRLKHLLTECEMKSRILKLFYGYLA
jgi:hypothetical protein